MPRNEDGEFELLVGNKQLLSIIFILFVMFGVVFAMGYVVGRNSAPEAAAAEPPRPQPRPETTAAQPPAPAPQAAAETTPAPGEAKATPPETQPVAEPPPAAPPPAAEPAKHEPAPEAASMPNPGETFLQVYALKRQLADTMADVLVKKGFPARVAPVVVEGQTGDLYRVLVGPLKSAADIAKTRRDLEAAGLPSGIKRQY